MMRMTGFIVLAAAFLFGALSLAQAKDRPVYATFGGGLEPDTCACAWVIARFIEPEALFQFHKPNTVISEGIQFDTPGASRYARRPNQAIVETIIAVHDFQDPALLRVAQLLHDIEINKWGENKTAEAAGLAAIVRGLNRKAKTDQECLEQSFVVFDALYAAFQEDLE